jgi:gliding motility-associated lipoprotein GldD
MRLFLSLLITTFLFTACGDGTIPVPKSRSYPRVEYPERAYISATTDYCNFSFDKPVSATLVRDDLFFADVPPDSCWFDLRFVEALNGSVHFSYYPIDNYETFEALRDEAFKLVGVHNGRASDIQEIVINREEADVHGIAFDIAGPAASPFQFFLTDTTNHFVRAALYFDAVVRPDSLKPIIAYAKEDIFRLVETFQWEK